MNIEQLTEKQTRSIVSWYHLKVLSKSSKTRGKSPDDCSYKVEHHTGTDISTNSFGTKHITLSFQKKTETQGKSFSCQIEEEEYGFAMQLWFSPTYSTYSEKKMDDILNFLAEKKEVYIDPDLINEER